MARAAATARPRSIGRPALGDEVGDERRPARLRVGAESLAAPGIEVLVVAAGAFLVGLDQLDQAFTQLIGEGRVAFLEGSDEEVVDRQPDRSAPTTSWSA